jgi:hypothetical protein
VTHFIALLLLNFFAAGDREPPHFPRFAALNKIEGRQG